MPKRRKTSVPLHLRAVGAGGALLLGVCDRAAQRPVDFVAISVAVAMSGVILVNALYLQTGSRSASYFTPPVVTATAQSGATASASPGAAQVTANQVTANQVTANQVTGTTSSKPAEQVIATRPVASAATTAPPARRDDPIADLIAPQPSPKVTAVQRALSEYGYGQIRPSGVLDQPTVTAIERFEREHKLPVTGRVSERLVSQLTALVGHSLN
ncbi:MAG TPA: peptidoglycan-binding domain-containing protein [Xanthobacteraceae bacterium]|nr:peptidoglycan-binding domain-containing protein [Xanthobacteraceae bacterium]